MANPLLPLVREAVEHVLESGDELTVRQVRSHMERDVDAYKLALRTIDPERALRTLMGSAIESALRAYPALPNGVHIDITREKDPQKIRALRDYRTEQIEDLERSRAALTNRLAQMTLDEELAEAVAPVEVPVE